ncbi:MAG: PD-(D/E)XK nuclease family protein [Thiotrichales bacterium]
MPAYCYNSSRNPLNALAAVLYRDHRDNPLALRQIQILMPELSQAPILRQKMLEQFSGQAALFAPPLTTLQRYVSERTAPDGRILNNHAQELMLVEVLQDHGYSWQLADELLRWFEALALSNHNPDDLQSELADSGFTGFDEDATKLAILWKAWQTQLKQEGSTTRTNHYRKGLVEFSATQPLYLLGYDWLNQLELDFLKRHLSSHQATILVQTDQPVYQQLLTAGISIAPLDKKPGRRTEALNLLFQPQPGQTFIDRCIHWKERQSPVFNGLRIFAASQPEEEAIAADRQVRSWIAEGKSNIAIVTEDRRLARRISAILRRSDIALFDEAGWPLSTTMAAGVVERWLETIETEFACQPLLDVLKNGFIPSGQFPPGTIFRFQRDIIEREQIPAGLPQYRQALQNRSARLANSAEPELKYVEALLDAVEHAAQPMLNLVTDHRHSPESFVHCLHESLQRLGLRDGLSKDPAGQRILQELIDMEQATSNRSLGFNWTEFRTWFGRALETHNFRPGRNPTTVSLLNLEQSRLGEYDAVLLAGAGDKQLPGPTSRHIFFNDSARYALNLKTREATRQLSFSRFRRLLESTRDITISYTAVENGESQAPSPWVSLLQSFAETAENHPLQADELEKLVLNPDAAPKAESPLDPPSPPTPAAPTMPVELIPGRISASAHQTLIACPYRYFASYGLGLKATEEAVELMTKREFGNLAHIALEQFYKGGDQSLPGPFRQKISATTAADALDCLLEIGLQLLAREQTTGFEQRAWQQEWRALARRLIDWEVTENHGWRNAGNEVALERPIPGTDKLLYGKIDRLDLRPGENQNDERIIDYKTGSVPGRAKIRSGESVQLLTYSLLKTTATEAKFLPLTTDQSIKLKNGVEANEIDNLRELTLKRLSMLLASMATGSEMPANGDAKTACLYCDFPGLCRTQLLTEDAEA